MILPLDLIANRLAPLPENAATLIDAHVNGTTQTRMNEGTFLSVIEALETGIVADAQLEPEFVEVLPENLQEKSFEQEQELPLAPENETVPLMADPLPEQSANSGTKRILREGEILNATHSGGPLNASAARKSGPMALSTSPALNAGSNPLFSTDYHPGEVGNAKQIAQIDHLSQSKAINVVLPQTTISTEGVKPLLSTGIGTSNRFASDEILEMNRAVANEERPIANAPLQSGPHANLGAISLASMKPETQGTRASPEITERGSKNFGEHSEHKTTKNSTKLYDVKSEMHTALSDFRSVSSLQTGQPTSGAREETLMLDAPSEQQNQMPIKGESLAHTTPHLSTGATHRTLPAGNIQAVSDAILTLRDSGGRIDVALAPEELGRLSIKLDNTAQGALFTLSAERGETQELIRRQLEQLQEQFRAMGFENAQFAFDGQGQAFGDRHNQEFEDSAALTTANKSPASVETRKFIAAGGLDIRI